MTAKWIETVYLYIGDLEEGGSFFKMRILVLYIKYVVPIFTIYKKVLC